MAQPNPRSIVAIHIRDTGSIYSEDIVHTTNCSYHQRLFRYLYTLFHSMPSTLVPFFFYNRQKHSFDTSSIFVQNFFVLYLFIYFVNYSIYSFLFSFLNSLWKSFFLLPNERNLFPKHNSR